MTGFSFSFFGALKTIDLTSPETFDMSDRRVLSKSISTIPSFNCTNPTLEAIDAEVFSSFGKSDLIILALAANDFSLLVGYGTPSMRAAVPGR